MEFYNKKDLVPERALDGTKASFQYNIMGREEPQWFLMLVALLQLKSLPSQ
jgi:hypothetical protein